MALSMNSLLRNGMKIPKIMTSSQTRWISTCMVRTSDMKDPEGIKEPYIPPYEEKINEPIATKRARLVYQSRKRGMLENGLLLSTFAAKFLEDMDIKNLQDYDRLINLPTNDWDIFYWATGVKPTPAEFDTEIMRMLKDHTNNNNREARLTQPALY